MASKADKTAYRTGAIDGRDERDRIPLQVDLQPVTGSRNTSSYDGQPKTEPYSQPQPQPFSQSAPQAVIGSSEASDCRPSTHHYGEVGSDVAADGGAGAGAAATAAGAGAGAGAGDAATAAGAGAGAGATAAGAAAGAATAAGAGAGCSHDASSSGAAAVMAEAWGLAGGRRGVTSAVSRSHCTDTKVASQSADDHGSDRPRVTLPVDDGVALRLATAESTQQTGFKVEGAGGAAGVRVEGSTASPQETVRDDAAVIRRAPSSHSGSIMSGGRAGGVVGGASGATGSHGGARSSTASGHQDGGRSQGGSRSGSGRSTTRMRMRVPAGGSHGVTGSGSSAASDLAVERLAQDAAQYIKFVNEWKVRPLTE